jgi:hypothetical protein
MLARRALARRARARGLLKRRRYLKFKVELTRHTATDMATTATTTSETLGAVFGCVGFALIVLCCVGWKRGWIYVEGDSGFNRPGAGGAVALSVM